MSDAGEGSGKFTVAIDDKLHDRFRKLPKSYQERIKSLVIGGIVDPKSESFFPEGQQMRYGLIPDGDKLFFTGIRYSYDLPKKVVVIIDFSDLIPVHGPH